MWILTFLDNAKWNISSLIARSFRKSVYCIAITMTNVACTLRDTGMQSPCAKQLFRLLKPKFSFSWNSLQKVPCSSPAVQNNAQTPQTKPIFSISRFLPFRKYIYHDNRFFCLQKDYVPLSMFIICTNKYKEYF